MLVSAQIPAIEKLGKEAKRQKGVEYESVGSFMLGMASKMAPKEQRATFEMLDHIDMIVSEDNTYLATLETRLKAIIRDLGASFIVKTDEEKTTHEVYGVKSGGVFTQLIIITKGKSKGYAVTAMSVGFIGFDGSLNQAITIRTFVSRNNELWFQAGGGIVAQSDEEYELQEVNNKLGALRRAIILAEEA